MTLPDRVERDALVGFVGGGVVGVAAGAANGLVLGAVLLGGVLAVLFGLLALAGSVTIVLISLALRRGNIPLRSNRAASRLVPDRECRKGQPASSRGR